MPIRLPLLAAALFAAIVAGWLAAPPSASAIIHEMVGADCRITGVAPEPAGQLRDGSSFARALQATGVIESFEVTATEFIVHFDLSRPNAKYKSAGFDLRIPGAGPGGLDLVLSPLPVPDGNFPAFAHCANLQAP